jgi:hypothetical protein
MDRPNLRRFMACAGLGIAVLLSGILASTRGAGAEGGPNRELRNDYLAVLISDRGELQRVEDLQSSETYEVEADSFTIVTDWGSLSNRTTLPTSHEVVPDRARYTFSNGKLFEVVLEYTLALGHRYLRRRLSVEKIDVPLTLLKVEFGRTAFQTAPQEIIKYDTFRNAPTVDFLRWEKGGLFTGIENPFFEAHSTGRAIALSFEPALLLHAGENYESEPQFVGVYSKSGYMIRDHAPKTRLAKDGVYRPRFRNPSGYIPLDRNEIRVMSEFAAEYLQVSADRFLFILYCYWNPMPQLPSTEADEKEYYRMIDNFHELGGDLIILNPLVKAQIPTEDPESF